MVPKMIVVAGPPGSGKSSIFPVASFGVVHFNADDRAAELNGSYVGISTDIRRAVNREFEAFVLACIETRSSFAIETTLRSDVTFEQASSAKAAGFVTEMRYLAVKDFAMHLERIKIRADAGGHSASEATLRRIYRSSLANLHRAVAEMDDVWVLRQFGSRRTTETPYGDGEERHPLPGGGPSGLACSSTRFALGSIARFRTCSACGADGSARYHSANNRAGQCKHRNGEAEGLEIPHPSETIKRSENYLAPLNITQAKAGRRSRGM